MTTSLTLIMGNSQIGNAEAASEVVVALRPSATCVVVYDSGYKRDVYAKLACIEADDCLTALTTDADVAILDDTTFEGVNEMALRSFSGKHIIVVQSFGVQLDAACKHLINAFVLLPTTSSGMQTLKKYVGCELGHDVIGLWRANSRQNKPTLLTPR